MQETGTTSKIQGARLPVALQLSPRVRAPEEICDELVRLYLRTFEAVLRVLHVPCFQREYLQYWSNPQAVSEPVVLQLLLVMAIGTCFYQDAVATEGAATLHCQATHWIHACHVRLAAPFRKKDLNLRRV